MFKRTESRRRPPAIQPNVEMVERRNLQGILGVSEVGLSTLAVAGQESSPQVQVQITPGTQIKRQNITELEYGDEIGTGIFFGGHFNQKDIKKSGKHFVILTLPPHTYNHDGTYLAKLTINNKVYTYTQSVSPF